MALSPPTSLSSRRAALLLSCVTGAWLAAAPGAAADPFSSSPGGQSASATIEALEAQGYNVQINWLNGYDTKPLSECRATRVDDPGDLAPGEGTFTTVYVDVVCPNGDHSGFDFGVGIG